MENSRSVTGCCARDADARRAALMPGAGARQSLFDARLNTAFGLAAHGGQLGDDEITRTLKHPLLAETEGLNMAQESQILEHVGDLENIAGTHLL